MTNQELEDALDCVIVLHNASTSLVIRMAQKRPFSVIDRMLIRGLPRTCALMMTACGLEANAPTAAAFAGRAGRAERILATMLEQTTKILTLVATLSPDHPFFPEPASFKVLHTLSWELVHTLGLEALTE
jgi:hypothetical protein